MTKKKVQEESNHEEKSSASSPKLVFTCNVNHDNKEYKAGDEWIGEAPECLKPFLK